MVVACPSMLITSILVFIEHQKDSNIFENTSIWAGFNFLVGFLIIFRTQQAYSRFDDGTKAFEKMGANWFDCASALLAYPRVNKVPHPDTEKYENIMIRLFSLLHGAALAEVQDFEDDDDRLFIGPLIDAQGLDNQSLEALRDSDTKVELIFQWIQQYIVDSIKSGILTIPPPILARTIGQLSNGMMSFHDALTISVVPFPFPYAQTCDFLLCLHWICSPFIVSYYVNHIFWASCFSFIQVFTLWVLNFIGVELENPFGSDPNDIDGDIMQVNLNTQLRLLIRDTTKNLPSMNCTREQMPMMLARVLDDSQDSDYQHICLENADGTPHHVHRNKGDHSFADKHKLHSSTATDVKHMRKEEKKRHQQWDAEGEQEGMSSGLISGAAEVLRSADQDTGTTMGSPVPKKQWKGRAAKNGEDAGEDDGPPNDDPEVANVSLAKSAAVKKKKPVGIVVNNGAKSMKGSS